MGLCAAAAVLPADAYHDGDTYNQVASMEFKQWSFTPKSYYYSWYMKDYFFFKTRMPGSGVHDKGPAGVSWLGGDNYVNEPWRLMSPLRESAAEVAKEEASQEKTQKEKWNDIFDQDVLTIADREIDAAYAITKSVRNRVGEEIVATLPALPLSGQTSAALEYARIKDNIDMIHSATIDNAKRLVQYEKENQALEDLSDAVEKAGMLHQLGDFLSLDEDEIVNLINYEL